MLWLHRLHLWQKFFLLGALALVMAAIPATLHLSRVMGDVEAARLQAEGAESAIALQKVIRDAQFHRGVVAASMSEESSLASLWRDDNDALASERPAASAALMKAIDDFARRLEAMAPSPAFVADWQDAGQRWAALDGDLASGAIESAGRSTELHSEWIGALLGLSDRLIDEYGLTRTQQPASHALVGTVFVHMPRIAEVLGQLRALGTIVLASRELPQESRTALTYRERLLEATVVDLDRSLSFVRAADPQLAARLDAPVAKMKEGITSAVKLIGREILEPEQIFLASDEYFRTMTATIDQVYAFNQQTTAALTGLFTARVAALQRGLIEIGAILALVAALGVAMMLVFVRSVTMPLREAIAFAGRVADGDLGTTLQARGSNEIGQLVTVLGQMRARIADVVGTVRERAEGVAVASAQIAQGNADLSARTEQQASALQQTAAAMEELSTTVEQNADHAQQADGHARQAGEVAATGGRVVADVVGTMKEINDSSNRIAEIVDVIDGIAFQTNILALNAAVEAARAGEQGRGFAVVAGEVRSLAQRSADAAREVKRLIDTSVERVDRGSELVARAGTTMQEIVASIRRVSDIVGEISNASAEQSAGVGQVRDAVADLDRNTQHNAALVEESAAAAATLRTQSQDLVQAVAVFRLGSTDEPGERERAARPHRSRQALSTWRSANEAGTGALTGSADTNEAAGEVRAPVGPDPAAVTVDRRGPDRATNVSRLPQSGGAGRGRDAGGWLADADFCGRHPAGGNGDGSGSNDNEAPDALRA